jgi:hypothetical protein
MTNLAKSHNLKAFHREKKISHQNNLATQFFPTDARFFRRLFFPESRRRFCGGTVCRRLCFRSGAEFNAGPSTHGCILLTDVDSNAPNLSSAPMDRLFSGLLNSVRRAATKPTPNGTANEHQSSSSKNTPKCLTYASWKTDAEAKIEAVTKILSPLLQRQERLYEFQTQLKKLNTSLNEIDALLAIDVYEAR